VLGVVGDLCEIYGYKYQMKNFFEFDKIIGVMKTLSAVPEYANLVDWINTVFLNFNFRCFLHIIIQIRKVELLIISINIY
jgi:hypothetical protein